jgi:hypothetical protein
MESHYTILAAESFSFIYNYKYAGDGKVKEGCFQKFGCGLSRGWSGCGPSCGSG